MNAVEVKIMLLRKGLTFTSMAEKLVAETDASQRSLEVMLADLLYGRRWYPALAQKVSDKFGITVNKPEQYTSIKDQIRQAA